MQSIGAPVNVYKGQAALRRGVVASEDPTGIQVVLAPQAEEHLPMLSSNGALVVPRRPQPELVFFSWDEVIEDDRSGPVRSIVLRDRHHGGAHSPASANDAAGRGCARSR